MTSDAPAASWQYLAREAVLLLGVSYLVFFVGISDTLVSFPLIRFGIVALLVAGAGWLTHSLARPVTHTPLSLPILVFLAVIVVAGVASIDPRRSLGAVWLAGLYGLVFAVTANLVASGWPRELFIKMLLVIGGMILALGCYLAAVWYVNWLATSPGRWIPTVTYRLPGPNTVAMFINLLLMPALARLMTVRARLPRLLLAAWIGAALGLLFLTSSRAGWLSAAAGIGVVLWLSARGKGARLRGMWQWVRQRRIVLVLAAGSAIAGATLIGWLALGQLGHPTHSSFDARLQFWSPAWAAFRASPFLGQGPFTYGSAYLRAASVPPNMIYGHAHNIVLNLLAETGAAGTLAFAWVVWAALKTLWQNMNQLPEADRHIPLGVIAALVASGVHGFFDTTYLEPVNPFVVAVLLGAALPSARPPGDGAPQLLRRWPAALWLGLVVTGAYGVWLAAPLRAGVLAGTAKDWDQAAASFSEAARRDPLSAVAHQQHGLALSQLAARGEPGTLEAAIRALEDTVRLDPDWALNHANLGVLYAESGDPQAGQAALREAARLAPQGALYHLNLGAVAEQAENWAEADQAYTQALAQRPDWAGAYFWRATPRRAALLTAWRQSVPQPPAPTLSALEAALAENPQYALPYTRLAQANLRLGRIQEADALLHTAAFAYVTNEVERLELLWTLADVAAARQDWAAAMSAGGQALDGLRSQTITYRGSYGLFYYGPSLFRREAMELELAPQLSLIVMTDVWAERMLTLGDWYQAAGRPELAAEVYGVVLADVPDSEAARARLLAAGAGAVD